MKPKKVLYVILGLFLISFSISYFTGYSFVIDFSSRDNIHSTKCKNDSIRPFENFSFNADSHWEMHIVFDHHDLQKLPQGLTRANYLTTSDIELLNNIKDNWKFICSGGDMATVTSNLILTQNGEVVFESGIHLNNFVQGLQSRHFGWIQSDIILNDIKEFERSYFPIIIL